MQQHLPPLHHPSRCNNAHMYACTQCDKRYASQNSLTRHVHVHSTNKKHTCSVCRLVFYRKDLLSRHSRLHDRRHTEQSTSAQLDAESGRQRCHTACTRCRELRTKCNGQRPCVTCSKAGSHCYDGRRSNRLSHLPAESEPSSTYRQEDQLSEPAEHPPLLDSLNHTDTDMAMDFQSDTDSQPVYTSHIDHLFSVPLIQEASSVILGAETSPFLNDVVSWPWLHEELFLPAPTDSFLNDLDSSGTQNFFSNSLTASGWDIPIQEPSFQRQGHEGHSTPSAFLGQDPATVSLDLPASAKATEPDSTVAASSMKTLSNDSSTCQRYRTTNQTRIVHDLVTWASTTDSATQSKGNRKSFLRKMAVTVGEAFNLSAYPGKTTSSTLHHFCDVYTQQFGPLWPLLSPQTLDFDALHPLLFLVLTSIGSMYCGSSASSYGAMLHTQICNTLIMPLLGHDDGDNDFLWLAQSRLLTQVAALYFGQPKAFTYAQHLGVLLVAQARRIDLFSATQAASLLQKFYLGKGVASDQERLSIWMQLEARRRLAFGIFRGDTYTSVLLHTKPLVSLEEIDLELPMCDSVWRGEGMAPGLCVQIIEHDQTPGRGLQASDIYRIALDRREPLPPLDPFGHELLIFGLQYPTWRFSRDQKMFERLTGNENRSLENDELTTQPGSVGTSSSSTGPVLVRSSSRQIKPSASSSEAHRLESAVRLMTDLELERSRLMFALEKWEQALPVVKTFVRTNLERSALLSGLILYHLGYLSLYAPLRDLHQIQYRLVDNRSVDSDLVHSIREWANSRRGRLAAERACSIWSMIARESQVTKERMVKFNLLAFAALHHGAVILWAYAGCHDFASDRDSGVSSLSLELSNDAITVHRDESTRMLQSFVELYDHISPARWCSFAKAADRLAHHPFPL